jgi:hypothetical protein
MFIVPNYMTCFLLTFRIMASPQQLLEKCEEIKSFFFWIKFFFSPSVLGDLSKMKGDQFKAARLK